MKRNFRDQGLATEQRTRAVPPTRLERDRLDVAVDAYLAARDLVPPLTLEEIRRHAADLAAAEHAEAYLDYLMVALGSAIWRDTIAAVPFERRVLLLPQCLRSIEHCRADLDDFGLLCARCGQCALSELERRAESLGYVVLIAEGTTVVTQLLEQGRIDAVIGVSCLEALEKSFPHMAAEAIPGMAIPLNQGGCVETDVDIDRVLKLLHLRSDEAGRRRDLDSLREEITHWFRADTLEELLEAGATHPGRVALEWLADEGKRWRPLLTVAAWQALSSPRATIPEPTRRLAVAVECFHKASLIHDDIEDGDESRYDRPALHASQGIPIALNVGDLLIGQGYRLIAGCGLPGERVARILEVAAEGHRTLSIGQGEELAWCRSPRILERDWVLEVFRMKTAPAFEVALRIGALCAEEEEPAAALICFCGALGVAYQIKDDLDDFSQVPDVSSLGHLLRRPSIVTALAFELCGEHLQADIVDFWRSGSAEKDLLARFAEPVLDGRARAKAEMLLDHYRNEAIRSLTPLRNAHLKVLLRRVTGRILGNTLRS